MVPWVGDDIVFVRRCGEADVDPVGDWLDVHLAGDYFFKRRHLRSVIVNPNSEAWAVEVEGQLIGFIAIYHGSMLHNLYLAANWRGKGLGSALVQMFRPTEIRAKTNMLAADPTDFYKRLGYRVVGQDPRKPHILEMAMDVRPATAAEQAAAIPGGAASSPPISPPREKAPPSIGRMTAAQVAAIAAKLRGLSDDELAAVAHAAATHAHWRKRQQAARERRLERERKEAAAAAGQHLAPDLTGEARAKVAAARASAAIAGMFGPEEVNGPPDETPATTGS